MMDTIGARRPWTGADTDTEHSGTVGKQSVLRSGSAASQLLAHVRAHVGEPIELAATMRKLGYGNWYGEGLLETVQHHMSEHIIYELEHEEKLSLGLRESSRYIIAMHKSEWGREL